MLPLLGVKQTTVAVKSINMQISVTIQEPVVIPTLTAQISSRKYTHTHTHTRAILDKIYSVTMATSVAQAKNAEVCTIVIAERDFHTFVIKG